MRTQPLTRAPDAFAYPSTAPESENQQLREECARKDAFMATLAHELRNALAPLSCALEIIERAPEGSAVVHQVLPKAQRQLQHMTGLLDDLLDIGRVLQGGVQLQSHPLDLRQLVAQTVDDFGPMLAERELALDLPDEPVWALGDAMRLRQALLNLLHNARKFTASGGWVRVQLRAEDGQAELAVADDGAGIAPQDLERIFGLFTQANAAPGVGSGGLGIGLALVRAYAQLHGGSVRAESAGPGHGACLRMRLPLMARSWQAAPAAAGPALARVLQGMRSSAS